MEIPDESGGILIGRGAGATLALPFSSVSKQHARFFRSEDEFLVEDLGSTHGTWVAGQRLAAHAPRGVRNGESLRIADVELVFEGEKDEAVSRRPVEGTETLARRLVHDMFAVAPTAECPRLLVLSGPGKGRELRLPVPGRRYVLGRGETCDFQVPDEDVSREHAVFERGAEGIVVSDLDSKNGVEVQGEGLTKPRVLRDGDVVRVGATRLRVVDPEERYLRALEASGSPKSPAVEALSATPPWRPGRLPLVATTIATIVLLFSLGLVLALALSA